MARERRMASGVPRARRGVTTSVSPSLKPMSLNCCAVITKRAPSAKVCSSAPMIIRVKPFGPVFDTFEAAQAYLNRALKRTV